MSSGVVVAARRDAKECDLDPVLRGLLKGDLKPCQMAV